MARRYFVFLLGLVLLCLYPVVGFTAVTIDYTFVLRENWGPNSLGLPEGDKLQIGANISDDLGVGNIMVPVMADSGVSDAWNYDLPYIGYGNGFWEVFDYDAQTGSWTITAQNKQNDTDSMVTHDLDKPRVVPLATGIQFAGPLLTPAISWDSVFFDRDGNPDTASDEVDQYRVRIYSPGSSFNIHDSGSFSGVTNYDVPSGVLDAGELYYVRVEARHLDGGGYLESRSNTFEPFSTVPIPGAVWLLGSGLVGLVGLRKKFKK